jgi:hypothetical protein
MFRRTIALAFAAAAVAAGSAQAAQGPSIGLLHEQTEHSLGVPVPASSKPGPSIGLLHEQTERALGVPAPGVGVVVATPLITASPAGFSWTDALIGAAMAVGVFLLGGAGALALRRRRGLAGR